MSDDNDLSAAFKEMMGKAKYDEPHPEASIWLNGIELKARHLREVDGGFAYDGPLSDEGRAAFDSLMRACDHRRQLATQRGNP